MLIFMYWLISVSSLTWYNPTFRGTALARKTQVMFFGFWWKNGFSAVRPEKSAIWRGWITWCSYLLPWRQQPTKVKVQKWEISSVLVYMWKPSKQRSCELIHCTVSSISSRPCLDGVWFVRLFSSFPQSPCDFLLRRVNSIKISAELLCMEHSLVPMNLTNLVGLESA